MTHDTIPENSTNLANSERFRNVPFALQNYLRHLSKTGNLLLTLDEDNRAASWRIMSRILELDEVKADSFKVDQYFEGNNICIERKEQLNAPPNEEHVDFVPNGGLWGVPENGLLALYQAYEHQNLAESWKGNLPERFSGALSEAFDRIHLYFLL
ncbi:hypothetical protein HK097_001043 [Rhizophlyctis rosea]|uniref:Uncharacterized protein n=1 Tax=Rhizophlyctis rosea TaxID=64517 RepID=A0AAD5SL18_9FUNG|nr:hypothetical protein HK097_001043 [Rhizophlyctis rosea]